MSEDTAPRERTRTIDLPEPIDFNGRTYTQLDLRVPKIGEMRKAQTHLRGSPDSETKMMIMLVSMVTGLPDGAIEKVDFDILMNAAEWLMGFMPGSPKTSEA